MRFDTSMESLTNVGRSESFMDLNNSDYGLNQISSWQQTTPTQKGKLFVEYTFYYIEASALDY